MIRLMIEGSAVFPLKTGSWSAATTNHVAAIEELKGHCLGEIDILRDGEENAPRACNAIEQVRFG